MKKDLKEYLGKIENAHKREDCLALVKMMEEESGFKARLHGKIVGFGLYNYVYESGREGVAIVTGFLPGSQRISLYIMPGFAKFGDEMGKIGKHKLGKSCLYINKLEDIDSRVLRKLVKRSVVEMKKRYTYRQG